MTDRAVRALVPAAPGDKVADLFFKVPGVLTGQRRVVLTDHAPSFCPMALDAVGVEFLA